MKGLDERRIKMIEWKREWIGQREIDERKG